MHIELRLRSADDIDAQLAGEDEELVRWLLDGKPSTRETVANHIALCAIWAHERGPRLCMGVYSVDVGKLAGTIEANFDDPDLNPGEVNLSFGIFPPFRRKGIARQAVLLMKAFVRRRAPASKVVLKIDPGNETCAAFARNLGFVPSERIVGPGLGLWL